MGALWPGNWDMSGWSIARRINTITLSMTLAVFLVGAMGLVAAFWIGGLFAEFQEDTNKTNLGTGIQKDIFEAQLAEMAYRNSPSDETAAVVYSNIDEVDAMLGEFVAAATDLPHLSGSIERIPPLLAEFRERFERIVALQAQRDTHVEEMTASGPSARKAINDMLTMLILDNNQRANTNLNNGLQEFLLARIFAERSLLTNSERERLIAEEHFSHAQNAFDNARAALPRPERQEAMDAAIAEFLRYRSAAEAAQLVISERNEHQQAMDRLSAITDKALDLIVDTVRDDQEKLWLAGKTAKFTVVGLLLAFSVLSLAASWALAHLISRRTTAAIANTVGQMQDLAGGNLDVETTGMHHEHELGEIARALNVFRENAIERRELEDKQRAQEAAERARQEAAEQCEKEAELRRQKEIEESRLATLRELSQSVGAVVDAGARGDFSQRIDAKFDSPELSEMARSINALVTNVEDGVAETARIMERLAEGDLCDRMSGSFEGTFAELKGNVNNTVEKLSDLVGQISRQCDELGASADQMNDQSRELARRAEQQAASLEETSAAMEQISASAKSSADGASSAAEVANKASERVEQAGGVVADAVSAMAEIRNAESRIGEIVSVIDGIAFQTNLLALNASVEAARAGAAGKGFAVVATEVRALAQRSAEASKDIKLLIDQSAERVSRGVELVERTGKTLEEIMGGVSEMAQSMKVLTATAREQATGVGEVTAAISQLDAITQKNAALSEQSREAASKVSGQSDTMRQLLAWFRTDQTAAREGSASIAAE